MTVSLLWIRTLICSLLSVLPFLHVKDFRRKELYVSIIGSCMILYVCGFLEDRIPAFELLPAYSIYPVLMWIPFRFLSSLLLFYCGLECEKNEALVLSVITVLFDACALVTEQLLLEYNASLHNGMDLQEQLLHTWGMTVVYDLVRTSYAIFLRDYFSRHSMEDLNDTGYAAIAVTVSVLLLVTIRSHAYIYTIIIVFGYPAVFLYFLDTRVISRKQRQREQALELNMHLSRNAIDAQMKQTQEILKDRHRQRKDCLTLIGMLESNEINQAKTYLQNEMIKEDAVLVQGNEYLDAMMRYLQVEFPYVVFTVEADLMPGEGVDSSDLAILVMTVIQILLPEGKSSSGIITVHIRKQGEMAVIRVLKEHHEKTEKPASIDTEELAIVNHLIRRYHGFSNNGYAAGDVRIALDNTVLTSS